MWQFALSHVGGGGMGSFWLVCWLPHCIFTTKGAVAFSAKEDFLGSGGKRIRAGSRLEALWETRECDYPK